MTIKKEIIASTTTILVVLLIVLSVYTYTLQIRVMFLEDAKETLEANLFSVNTTVGSLVSRVEVLENQMLMQGFLRAPVYDSGWISVEPGHGRWLNHNLNTTEVFVYIIGKSDTFGIHQQSYGGIHVDTYRGVRWGDLNATHIRVHRFGGDNEASYEWSYVRVMIWIIQEPTS